MSVIQFDPDQFYRTIPFSLRFFFLQRCSCAAAQGRVGPKQRVSLKILKQRRQLLHDFIYAVKTPTEYSVLQGMGVFENTKLH